MDPTIKLQAQKHYSVTRAPDLQSHLHLGVQLPEKGPAVCTLQSYDCSFQVPGDCDKPLNEPLDIKYLDL